MGDYGIGVPMNVRCEGTTVLYHKNSIRDNTVGVFHNTKKDIRTYYANTNIYK